MAQFKRKGKNLSGIKKSQLNTTIRTEVLDAFKVWCDEHNTTMNEVIEGCMASIVNGDLRLGITGKIEYYR